MSTLVLAIVGICALIFARGQIAEMHEEARIQQLTAFVNKFDSHDRITIRRNLALKRVDQKQMRLRQLDIQNPPVELEDELDFCEDIGLLTDHGYLDRHDVWNQFGVWLFYLYTDARPYLDNLQSPADYRVCMNLVESIRPIEAKEGANTYDHPSESDLYDSYMEDIQRQSGQPAYRARGSKKP
jgi:hypothetical protein